MMKGFHERVSNEYMEIVGSKVSRSNIDFKNDSLRRFSAWIGGSMMGSLSTF